MLSALRVGWPTLRCCRKLLTGSRKARESTCCGFCSLRFLSWLSPSSEGRPVRTANLTPSPGAIARVRTEAGIQPPPPPPLATGLARPSELLWSLPREQALAAVAGFLSFRLPLFWESVRELLSQIQVTEVKPRGTMTTLISLAQSRSSDDLEVRNASSAGQLFVGSIPATVPRPPHTRAHLCDTGRGRPQQPPAAPWSSAAVLEWASRR